MKTKLSKMETNVPSQFLSAIHARCPKCRVGKMFSTPIYQIKGQQMNIRCPHCDFQFEIEPGYYYVAMFASYALNVAEMVTFAIAAYILTGSNNPWVYVTLLIFGCLILAPFNFRYSRVMLLYWLTPGIHYEPKRSMPDYDPRRPNQ